jgi:hypothetical protein
MTRQTLEQALHLTPNPEGLLSVGMHGDFSNAPNSYQSSIGLYETGQTYSGKHGRSMIFCQTNSSPCSFPLASSYY